MLVVNAITGSTGSGAEIAQKTSVPAELGTTRVNLAQLDELKRVVLIGIAHSPIDDLSQSLRHSSGFLSLALDKQASTEKLGELRQQLSNYGEEWL